MTGAKTVIAPHTFRLRAAPRLFGVAALLLLLALALALVLSSADAVRAQNASDAAPPPIEEAIDAIDASEASGSAAVEAGNAPLAVAPRFDDRTSVVIGGGDFQPIPIALPRFRAVDPAYEDYAIEISDVIAADLERSGLFTVIGGPPLESIDVPPDLRRLSARGAVGLIAGEVELEPDGRLAVRFRLWDVREAEERQQLRFLAAPTGARRVGHKVADIVYTDFTGEPPYFDTRIVFVEVRGPKEDRQWRLAMMDSDGANVTYLIEGEYPVLTPRFSPATQEITFVSFQNDVPEVYLLNLTTERDERLGAFPGVMSFAPRFSPDGGSVVMSIANEEGIDIYRFNLATRDLERLTTSLGIDTAPSFSPDGRQIVFESDRAGGKQIYVMNLDGGEQRRISSGVGGYGTPVWAPNGDWIAFTKYIDGRFHIGVMRPDGSDERLLTSSYLDDGPTWAPNGRVLMFFREPPGEDALPQLYTIDIFRGEERLLPLEHGATDPAWSPVLGN